MSPLRVSVHGCHSGQFCDHAEGLLEDFVKSYIEKGFCWIGITEHMPAEKDCHLPPEERKNGLSAEDAQLRFEKYIQEAFRLKEAYKDQIQIYVGFETEGYVGAGIWAQKLILKYRPDYVVASVHHIHGHAFDHSPEEYEKALKAIGSPENLYNTYFDRQYELFQYLSPQVVGHFDLIRIFDQKYEAHFQIPSVWKRIERNLAFMKEHHAIFDFNLRALSKGAKEPYICAPILKRVLELGIKVVPGEDSHSPGDCGRFIDQGLKVLKKMGVEGPFDPPSPFDPKFFEKIHFS